MCKNKKGTKKKSSLNSYFPGMEAAIIRSHERSKAYGVDPKQDGAPEETRLSPSELAASVSKQQEFYDIGREQLDILYRLLNGTGVCMALADAQGYVLYVVGDAFLLDHFRQRRCLPGYRWTERDIGTCAIGIALAEEMPVFLPGEKMYSQVVRKIANAGAPVFSPDGKKVLGAVSLSSESTQMNVHTLGLVRQAAETVTVQMRERQRSRELAIGRQYLRSLLDSDRRGLVAVSPQGQIMASNRRGRALLSLPQECEGLALNKYLYAKELDLCMSKGISLKTRELSLASGEVHFVSFEPIKLASVEVVGGLITIQEKRDVMRMATEVTGNKAHFTFDSILGKSPKLQTALQHARIAARAMAPVLLSGETGTGKELFAHAIHNASQRADQAFVALNCAAIPKELLESELFGYEEGAFTGARKGGQAGKLELASGGTLFLDEIGEMPLDMQAKLLRVLQSGENRRVGSLRSETVDLRIIAATHVDLKKAIEQHKFREDLYYRISTFIINIPPLRERQEDILPITRFFMERHAAQLGLPESTLSSAAERALLHYPWPGNIRQLENAVERALYLAKAPLLQPEDFGMTTPIPEEVNSNLMEPLSSNAFLQAAKTKQLTLAELEQEFIQACLDDCQGNISRCAARLGISRPRLYRKLAPKKPQDVR